VVTFLGLWGRFVDGRWIGNESFVGCGLVEEGRKGRGGDGLEERRCFMERHHCWVPIS